MPARALAKGRSWDSSSTSTRARPSCALSFQSPGQGLAGHRGPMNSCCRKESSPAFPSDTIFYSRKTLLRRFSAPPRGTLGSVPALLQLPAASCPTPALGEDLQVTAMSSPCIPQPRPVR